MSRTSSRRRAVSSFGSRTDVGCVRDHNEDSLAVAPPLYVVCDGMGGHAAGEVASEIAVDVITARAPRNADAAALGQAVEEANLAIIEAAQQGRGRAGMGCTCTAAIIEKERLVIAQVGDSRAYLLHQGTMQQLTRDHSLVADLIEAGEITEAEARVHPKRSMITRALGSDPRTQPDLFEVKVESGDRLLLCSDGLTTMLEDPQIERILRHSTDPQRCAAQLVNEANALGGYDNITVIVVDIEGLAAQKQKRAVIKSRVTAITILVLLAAIVAAGIYGFNYYVSQSAYIIDNNGKVAIYQGVPGDVFGLSSHTLIKITNVETDELQPGTAKSLREGGIRVSSLEEAEALVREYEAQIEETKQAEESGAASESSNAAGSSAAGDTADGTAGDNTVNDTETDAETDTATSTGAGSSNTSSDAANTTNTQETQGGRA
jgi:protein phosphatase